MLEQVICEHLQSNEALLLPNLPFTTESQRSLIIKSRWQTIRSGREKQGMAVSFFLCRSETIRRGQNAEVWR